MNRADNSVAAPTAELFTKMVSLKENTARMKEAEANLVPLALSYYNHLRSLTILVLIHIPLTLGIAIATWWISHLQASRIAVVESVLLGTFAFALYVFGVQTHRIWMPRAFAIAMLCFSLWGIVAVLFALHDRLEMRRAATWVVIGLQIFDVIVTSVYWLTVEQMAGVGGESSAIVAQMHRDNLIVSPLQQRPKSVADVNRSVLSTSVWRRLWGTNYEKKRI